MTIAGWIIVAVLGFSTLLVVANVGKPRKPTTPGDAVGVLLVNVIIIAVILTFGTGKGLR